MREILFRGKTPGGWWVYGDHIKDRIQTDGKPNEYIMIRFFNVFEGEDFEDYEFIIPETIGQYTGLKDKNGKMIFEGDLIRTTNNGFNISKQEMRGIVEYVNCGFVGNRKNMAQDISLRSSDLEIIGNIHDNQELLK